MPPLIKDVIELVAAAIQLAIVVTPLVTIVVAGKAAKRARHRRR